MGRISGLVLVGAVFLFVEGVQGGGKKEPAKTFLIDKNAEEIAKDFEKDYRKALTEYDPNPPAGGAGGAIIKTGGEVKTVMGKRVVFKTGSKVEVVLDADKIEFPNPKGKRMVVGNVEGRLNTKMTTKDRVVIRCETVTLKNITGDDK